MFFLKFHPYHAIAIAAVPYVTRDPIYGCLLTTISDIEGLSIIFRLRWQPYVFLLSFISFHNIYNLDPHAYA
jgi:hypothetical protein